MVTTRSGRRTSNQQELSVLISDISILTSSQCQPQEIMAAPAYGIQDPYLAILNISTSEHLKLLESDRYDLTRSKWNGFYQEMEDAVSTFGFK